MAVAIGGFCGDRFRPFLDAFRANFDEDLELGSSLAVTHRGRAVADLWGGWSDPQRTLPWREHTIVQVFSTSKIMLNLSTLMVIDRGLLELDRPVAQYWPEFAAGGKEAVTVRDVLTHQGGVPGFSPPVAFEALHDWSGITAHIAAQPHWFEGRRVLCYHPTTFGFVLGELIRRVDGRRPAQFFREEIATRVRADFQPGLSSRSDASRVAELQWPAVLSRFPEGSLSERRFNSVGLGDWSRWERLAADIPASNGYGNGRSIARICSILALGGELDGERFLSRELVEEASKEQVYAQDDDFGWLRLGLGFGLDSARFPAPTPTSFHWGGYGGSWGAMDPAIGVSLGFACNNMIVERSSLDPRLQKFSDALAELAPGL